MIRITIELDCECRRKKPRLAGFGYVVGPILEKSQPRLVSIMSSPLAVVISTTQKATIALKPLDQFKNPIVIPTGVIPVWTVSSGSVVPVVAPDGLSAILANDTPGDSVIDVTVPDSEVTGQIQLHVGEVIVPPVLADLGLFVVSIDPK